MRQWFSIILALAVLNLSFNKVFNWHTHIAQDGTVYQHAHPYNHHSNQHHQHNKTEQAIWSISGGEWNPFYVSSLLPSPIVIEQGQVVTFVVNILERTERLAQNKSPPFSSFK
ncbi:MAG: hypothetical protein JXR60_07135 [Bacteroidales bacterium]|nr:hypothetical protein [Bacteroidales bacterium]